MARILADEFSLITAQGEWRSREQELSELTDYGWTHREFNYHIKRLDIFDHGFDHGSAIVAGEGQAQGMDEQGEYQLRYQSSNVLIWRGQRWQAVSSHVSGVQVTRAVSPNQ